jgi:hypothetical protein
MIVYCCRTGEIGVGSGPCPSGALPIIRHRSKKRIRQIVAAAARHAYDNHRLLVPGLPEAQSEDAAFIAVEKFRVRIAATL